MRIDKIRSGTNRPPAPPSAAKQRDEQGQSILEMAITLPILLLILIAVVDLARAFDAYIVLTNAAREGARYGSRDPSFDVADIQLMVARDVLGSGTNITRMEHFTTTDVLVAQTLLTQTMTNYYNALYDFKIAKAVLYRALGQEVLE